MSLKEAICAVGVLVLSFASAGAQTVIPFPKGETRRGGSTTGKSSPSYPTMEVKPANPSGSTMDFRSKYDDTGLPDLEQKMAERDWSSESTAWQRASDADTKEAYKRYTAIYPNGAHISEAYKRLIDIEVKETMSKPHSSLPSWTEVEADEDSPTSTIIIENKTGYPLTVMFSGENSKSILIATGGVGSVTLDNGTYGIAASVPDPHVRPFAGSQSMEGGRFKTAFYVVWR